jgi:hypothetical protein
MSSPKRTRKKEGLRLAGVEAIPTLPLDIAQDSATNLSGDCERGIAKFVSETKKLISSVLQTGRTVSAALANPEHPNPALVRGITAFKESTAALLNSGDLESLEISASKLIEDALKELPSQVKRFCEVNGLKLWGAFPDYIIEGTVYFKVDSKHFRVQINEDIGAMFPVNDCLGRVRDKVSTYSSVEFQASRFLSQLWQAYQLAASRRKSSTNITGQRVSVFEILPEMAFASQSRQFFKSPTKESFRAYSQHMFRADLYRLVSGATGPVIDGLRLVLEPTSVAEDGLFMFLPSVGRCAFVGHIMFLPIQ